MCRSRKGSLYCTFLQLPTTHVTVSQQGSVFGDAAGTRRHGQALNALAVTQSQWRPKGPFLRRSCQDIHFREGPGSFRRLFPLVTCLPSQGCVAQLAFQAGVRSCPFPVTALPNRGKLFQAWATGLRCGEQVARVCWTKRRLLGDGRDSWRTTWHRARDTRGVTRGRGMGGVGWGERLQLTPWGPLKAGVQGPSDQRERLKELQGLQGPVQFHPTSHLSDGKTEAQGEKRELAKAAQQVLSSLLSRMGTQILHGAWATSVACREAQLRGWQTEPGNVGDSAEEAGKDPWWASSSEEGEPGL